MTVPDGEEESELDRGLLSDGHELEPLHPLMEEEGAGGGEERPFHQVVGSDGNENLLYT